VLVLAQPVAQRSQISCEVTGPRDGLQNEAESFQRRISWAVINRIAGAGVKRIGSGQLVHPGALPQMTDAEGVIAGDCADRDDISNMWDYA